MRTSLLGFALTVVVGGIACANGRIRAEPPATASAEWSAVARRYSEMVAKVFSGDRSALSSLEELNAVEEELIRIPPPRSSDLLGMLASDDPNEKLMALAAVYVGEAGDERVLERIVCGYDARAPLAERFLAAHAMGQRGAIAEKRCVGQVVERFSAENQGLMIAAAFPALLILEAGPRLVLATQWFEAGNEEVRRLAYLLVQPLGRPSLNELRAKLRAKNATKALESLTEIEAGDRVDPAKGSH